jgi:3-oxoadipate enol-lactonase
MVITHDDTQLYYEVHGNGRPLLAVHGFPLSGKLWAEVTPDLARDHRLIVPDLRGLGQSRPTPDTSMGRYVEDLVAVLAEAKVDEPVILMGLSMGGYILMEFWRRYPEKVAALILANTRAQADTLAAAEGRYTTAEKVLAEGSHVVADSMVEKLFAASAPAELKEEWHGIMANSSPVGVAAALKAMAERPDSLDTLTTITVPTLIIAGREDTITPVSDAETMHRLVEGSTLAIIEEAGHMTPVESPGAFAMAVQQFLRR